MKKPNRKKITELVIPTEIYSRCVGYFRPVAQWNAGKKAEFADRKPYDANKKLAAGVGQDER